MVKCKKKNKTAPQTLPEDQQALESAVPLCESAVRFGYRLFKDIKFRLLSGFPELDQTEQDRKFNELIASALTRTMLVLIASEHRVDEEKKAFYEIVSRRMPEAYLEWMKKQTRTSTPQASILTQAATRVPLLRNLAALPGNSTAFSIWYG